MNNYIRLVLWEIANGDMKRARKATIDFLRNNKTQKDKAFCESMIAELEKKLNFTQLPEHLKGMLILENVSDYPVGKIMWRDEDKEIANKVISMYYVAERMERFGIKYLPSAILYTVKWDKNLASFILEDNDGWMDGVAMKLFYCEVIGNIHCNKEK